MGAVSRFLQRLADWQRPGGWSIINGSQPTEYKATGRTVRLQGWEKHPIVNACARVITDQIAAVPLEIYKLESDGETEALPMHPALDVLEQPSPMLSAYRLRARWAMHFVLYGNAFTEIQRGGRSRPVGLRTIHPERIQYVHIDASTDRVLQYDWTDTNGRTHSTPWEDMIHLADLDASEDGIFGFPRAASALLDISTDHEASEYVRQMVKNSGAPGLAVLTEANNYSPESIREAEESWHNKFAVRGHRGRTAFMQGVKDIKVLGFNLQQLEFPDLRRISREDICAAFLVDPRMVGAGSAGSDGGLSGVQYEEARRRLEHQTCKPIRTSIEAGVDLSFTPEYGLVYCRFSPMKIAELTEDKEANHKRAREDLVAGGITREEFRAETGRPEEMDPTHTLVGSISRLEYPVAMAVQKTETQTAPPEPPDDDKPDDEPSSPAERAGPVPHARVIRRGVALSQAQRDTLWSLFDVRATKLETSYERTALMLFANEKAGVAAIFDAVMTPGRARALIGAGYGGNGNGTTRESPDDPFVLEALRRIEANYRPDGAYHEAWLERYLALIGETVAIAGGEIAAMLGVDFTLTNPRVRAVIRRRAANLVKNVTETTRQAIRAAVESGRAAGMGIRDIASLIDETTFGEITGSRATTIARTESVGSLNAGEFEAAVQSRVLRSKEWLTQGDGRVRDTHAAINGQRVDIGSAFGNGLQHPHAEGAPAAEVIQCRCACLFYDEEAPA
jgi:HK97 family phage portal protein